ncbi:MAG: protein phosphatase 2C domain-containing protein [Candidatus Sericytochromatia bacterium]
MSSIFCPSCNKENDSQQEFCSFCACFINKEFFVITQAEIKSNNLNHRYSFLDKNSFLVVDNSYGKPTFDSDIINDDSLLNLYQKYDKFGYFPKAYDAFNFDGNDYLLITSNKDLYGQEYRNIQEAIIEITDRNRIQLIKDSALIFQQLEKDDIQNSILQVNNFFVDDYLNIKLKYIKSNDSELTLKNLGELWKKLFIPKEMPFLEYSKYKVGEILKHLIDGKITDIKELIKKLDILLDSDFTEVKYYSLSDIGKKRDNNEDNFYSILNAVYEKDFYKIEKSQRGLFIICDGMGGHEKGEVASKMAVDKIKRTLLPAINFKFGFDEMKKLLEEALIYQANDYIYKENLALGYEFEKKMGTTALVCMTNDNYVYTAHIGDSRLYVITQKGIEQLTQDHNVAMQNYNEGKGSWNDAMKNTSTSWGKMLSQALGIKDNSEILPEINFVPIQENSYLLMCTDGLSDMLSPNDIKTIVINNWDSPQKAVENLIDKANELGGKDNITVTLVNIKPIHNFLPLVDYADIFYNSEIELNEELIEMTEFKQESLGGIMIEPDQE